jgi:hypothetical protein
MKHFVERNTQEKLRLSNLAEVNQYCFFVAGIVGETLARIVSGVDANMRLNRELLKDAHHFGLFLQKVNLLKDQKDDEREGKFLIPSRDQVYDSAAANAEGAFRYILAIPDSRLDYKVFCLWSLFLGLKTLPIMNESTLAAPKISRNETMLLFGELETIARDNQALDKYFQSLMLNANFNKMNTAESDSQLASDWISDCYKGLLEKADLVSLGLVGA